MGIAVSGAHATGKSTLIAELSRTLRNHRLDLVVLVPIEQPDRIRPARDESVRFRRRVDAALRSILVDDALGLGISVLEVTGSPRARARQVLVHLGMRDISGRGQM